MTEADIHLTQCATRHDRHIVIEEIACAIADAQAALFTGRFHDLESCTVRLQGLSAVLKSCHEKDEATALEADRARLISFAQSVHRQNRVFAAVLHRVRRHLETLRNLLNGRSLSYQPQILTMPERKK